MKYSTLLVAAASISLSSAIIIGPRVSQPYGSLYSFNSSYTVSSATSSDASSVQFTSTYYKPTSKLTSSADYTSTFIHPGPPHGPRRRPPHGPHPGHPNHPDHPGNVPRDPHGPPGSHHGDHPGHHGDHN